MDPTVKKYHMINKLKTAPVECLPDIVDTIIDSGIIRKFIVLKWSLANTYSIECEISKNIHLCFNCDILDDIKHYQEAKIEIRCRNRIIHRGEFAVHDKIKYHVPTMIKKMNELGFVIMDFYIF